jgi:hypothetical protein
VSGADDSWITACEGSFAWFKQFYSDHFEVPEAKDIHAWISLIQLDTSWNGRVKTAGKRLCLL